MSKQRMTLNHLVALLLSIPIFLIFTIPPAHAGRDEMALFFDEMVQYGDWVDYKQYGPIWYPTKVEECWRPYLDGRWVPSAKGWVFETTEPWGWATYHFGNWMPTQEYGWVWVPGSTWYPSTATWRKTNQAIGWAPVPPPDYEPEPAFVPLGGFPAETPVQEKLIPAMYVFAPGSVFLQGMNQPYTPEYSYQNSGGLVPQEQIPELFPQTELINNFVYAALNPEAVANWGPPLDQVSECTGVSPVVLWETTSVTDVTVVQNCWPPPVVLYRRAYFGYLLPPPAYVVRPLPLTERGRYLAHLYGHRHVRIPHDRLPHPPHNWQSKHHPRFASAASTPGHPPRFLGLPPKATSAGGLRRPGGPVIAGGKGPIINRQPPPISNSRRSQLEQERARMAEHRQQIQQAKIGKTSEGTRPEKLSPKPESGGKSVLPGGGSQTPGAKPQPPSATPGTAKATPPPQTKPSPTPGAKQSIASPGKIQTPSQPPPTAEQLKQQREAQEQEKIKQLQQKQQASGIAPGGQIASPSGSASPPGGGPGMGSASPPASGGGVRPPKGYSGPTDGSKGSPAPGGFGVRPPKTGGGTGPPSVSGKAGATQAPKVQTQQVRPSTPPKSGGGGGGGKSAPPQKKEEKKKQ